MPTPLLPDELAAMSDWSQHTITSRLVAFINQRLSASVTSAINQRNDMPAAKNALDTAAVFKQLSEAIRSGEFLVSTRTVTTQTPTTE